jgi:hypothetical protein
MKSSGAETVIIQIIEEPRKIEPLPRAHIAPQPTQSTKALQQEAGNASSINARSPEQASLPPPPPAIVSIRSNSPALVRSNSLSSQSPRSPFVPMRSMFPTYNPTIPLSQQPYYPQREASLPGQASSREDYSPHLTSPSQLDEVLGGAKTAPSSIIDFPMDDPAIKGPTFSSVQELDRLWEATNGQEPDAVISDFDLQMSR